MLYQDLIDQMSLEEKCALLSGYTAFGTRPNARLGIPAMNFSDGPHGMRVQDEGANHLGLGTSRPATCFPTAVTVANSWNPQLGEELGHALAQEAGAQGVSVMLGPGLCIKRDPLCGRNFEYFSEDPYLAGKMAAGYVRGMESTGLSSCPKHFAVNSQETRRQAYDAVIDERTLREIYLTGFEIVVKESNPTSLMSSYNLINGTYANENQHLLRQILVDEWGFTGTVVTDWGGSNDHVAGVKALSAFEMPSPGLPPVRELIDAVNAGTLSMAELDLCVEKALELVMGTKEAVESCPKEFDVEGHHALARKIAAEGIVLLKNEEDGAGQRLLPLEPGRKVALIGDFAKTPRYQGAGSSLVHTTKLDTVLDCVLADERIDCIGYEQGFGRNGDGTAAMADSAVALAQQADVVLMCLGLGEIAESEGADRTTMRLNQDQTDLLAKVAAANPNIVVMLFGGSSVECDWVGDARAILYCALGGQAGAAATVDALTGDVNPSGKLAETWVWHYEDVPTYGHYPAQGKLCEYREGPYYGYRYFLTNRRPVAFPFGFGLSYTAFEYADLAATTEGVELTVSNVGERAGAEVVQLYVAKPEHEVFRPEHELKGFSKVWLEPGESKRVRIDLDDKAFRYWNVGTNAWEIEGGTYELRVGAAVDDIRLAARVEVEGTGAPNPYEGLDMAPYETGEVLDVDDAHFAALLGHDVPSGEVTIDRDMCFCDLKAGRSPVMWVVWAVLNHLKTSSEKAGKPNLNVLFIWNMPLHALAKMGMGYVSMGLVDAIVREVKGWGLVGIVPFLLVGVLTGRWGIATLVWLLWFLLPILWEFVANLAANSSLASRLARLEAK